MHPQVHKNGPGAVAAAHRASQNRIQSQEDSLHKDTAPFTDRQLDEIADRAAQARALADIAEAKAETYVPQPGHRIEFYIRELRLSGRVEVDVFEGTVQRVDIDGGCVVIGDDDVPDWFVPLADVIGRIPVGLAANISRFVCWVRGNYGNTVHAADLLDVLRAVQFDSDEIQQAALRAAADRLTRRRADGITMTAAELLEYVDSLPSTSEPVDDEPGIEWPIRCARCESLCGVSAYPPPPMTLYCPTCSRQA